MRTGNANVAAAGTIVTVIGAVIMLALYGAWPVSTVLLVPPRTGSVS